MDFQDQNSVNVVKSIRSGYSDFAEIQRNNLYFVDKTKVIEHWVNQKNSVTVLTRPRRFGKSLTLSVLENFLSIDYKNLTDPTAKAKTLFKDSYIAQNKELCELYMAKYVVLSISFQDVYGTTYQSAVAKLRLLAQKIMIDFSCLITDLEKFFKAKENNECSKYFSEEQIKRLELFSSSDLKELLALRNKETSDDLLSEFLDLIIRSLKIYFDKPIILIIDEYDVPLNEALMNGYYEQMLAMMKSIMGVIKSNKNVSHFIIAGCIRIAQESIISGANNITHYSIDSIPYSTDIGFTKEETLELLKASHLDKYIDQVEEWYDGYIFGNTRMLCPWEIIRFCEDNTLSEQPQITNYMKTYWINTSSNSILATFVDHLTPSIVEKVQLLMDGQKTEVPINDHLILNTVSNQKNNDPNSCFTYSEQALWTILYHTGYLTRDDRFSQLNEKNENSNVEYKFVKIPNKEIYVNFKSLLLQHFSIENKNFRQNAESVLSYFVQEPSYENSSLLRKKLSLLLNNFISIRDGSSQEYSKHPEWYYHSFLNGMFSQLLDSATSYYRSNRELGNGYADISFLLPDEYRIGVGVIIELKVAPNIQDLKNRAQDALQQIKNRDYHKGFFLDFVLDDLKVIDLYGISFCGKECYVVAEQINKD